MSYYSYANNHSHPLDQCGRSDFYQGDCDLDDILTWREYHNFRFKRKSCSTNEKDGWSPAGQYVVFQANEIDSPPQIHALSSKESFWSQEYSNIVRERMQKLADREAKLMKKYGITRP